jgi:carbonic anhydrase
MPDGPEDLTRRGFAGLAAGAGLLATGMPASHVDARESVPSPRDALRLLMQGNRRWVRARAVHPHQSVPWRLHVAEHQEPFATVVSCIDSRVPPEIVFDRGVGDMFVVRTGAQTLDDLVVLGSIEFGPVNYRSARLLVVLGHEKCGAVIAAIESIETGKPAPGHIRAVVDALRPAYRAAKPLPGDLVDNMIRAQIRLTVCRLRRDPLLRRLIADSGLLIIGGYYHLRSGAVDIIA